MRAGAARVEPAVRRAIATAAAHIATVAARQIPKHGDIDVAARRLGRAAGRAARPRRLLRAGRPLSAALVAADDGGAGAGRRRRARSIAVCPRPEPAVMAAALEAGVTALFRIGGAHAIAALAYGTDACRASTRSSAPATATSRPPKRWSRSDCAIDFYAGPTEIVIVAGGGQPEWIAADLIAQAEHDPDARAIFITWSRAARDPRRRRGRAPAARAAPSSQQSLTRERRRRSSRATPTRRWRSPTASRPSIWSSIAKRSRKRPLTAGAVFVGPYTAQAAGDYATGSNHVLPTAGRGAISRRPVGRRLRPRHVGAAHHARRARASRADDPAARPRRGARGARRIDRGPSEMSHYQKPPELYEGLRLHQNENTGGCSPRVHRGAGARCGRIRSASIRRTRRRPPRCASYLRVPAEPRHAGQRPRRRHHGGRGRLPARGHRRTAARIDRAGAGVRDLPLRHRGRRRQADSGDAAAGLQLSARRGAWRRSRRTPASSS